MNINNYQEIKPTKYTGIFDFLKKYKEIYFIAPIVVYIVGFLYTQGSFSSLNGLGFINDGLYPVIPLNHEIYLFRGLYVLFGLIAPVLVVTLMLNILMLNNTKHAQRKFKIHLKIPHFKSPVKVAFYTHFTVVFLNSILRQYHVPINDMHILFYFSLLTLIHYAIIKSLVENYKYKNLENEFRVKLMFCLMLILITLLISIYQTGYYTQQYKLQAYLNGQPTKIVEILTTEGMTESYMLMDMNKDTFIGINKDKEMVIYPIKELKSIEIRD